MDQFPEISGANQVMGVPTVVILKDGEIKERFVGVQPKEVIKKILLITIMQKAILVLQIPCLYLLLVSTL